MTIAVVPIFMSAGAAVLPTVVVAITSVVAIIFKPRELLRLFRERPLAVGGALAAVVVLVGVVTWWVASPSSAARGATVRDEVRAAPHADWAAVADRIFARQIAGKAPTAIGTVAAGDAPLVLGHDYSRCSFAGGALPEKLHELWNYHPEDGLFLSTPVVAGNRIFVAGCQSDLGGYTGILACLDAQTGNKLWEHDKIGDETLKAFFSSPALTADGKNLIVGQGLHQDKDCSLLCFEADTGKLSWAAKTPLHIESSPAIVGDMAIVGAGAIEGPDGKATGNPGYVFAVRISDGKELWKQPVNDPESAPAVDENGIVYIGSGFNGCAVVAMRSDTDEDLKAKKLERIVWQRPVDFPVTCPITLTGDMVIAGSGNGDVAHSNANAQGLVVALDRKTGAELWHAKFDDSVLGPIAARDGLAICPVRTGKVVALSLKDGSVVWTVQISGKSPVLAGCAFTGTRVVAVSSDGYMAVIDPKEGRKIGENLYLNAQAKAGSGLTVSGPQISGGCVIVGSETGGLHCLAGSGQ